MMVRITQLDGTLPNLALMKLAAFHKAHGDEVVFTRSPYRHLDEPEYGRVYGSAIFAFSSDRVDRLKAEYPEAIIGGTGTRDPMTVEQIIGQDWRGVDYSMYPKFDASIGFTQRGCRLACKFCVVPWKEGKPRSENTVAELWRGPGYPKHIHLLDNDFFGGPGWQERIAEIREGGFKVCFSQGINVRMVTDEVAEALASIEYRDDGFQRRRLYTAWDNLKDEKVFFKGVDILERAGVPPHHLMVYMLVGFDKKETWERIFHRFNRMTELGIRPYPMVFDIRDKDPEHYRQLKRFQRWAIRPAKLGVPWEEYSTARDLGRADPRQGDLFMEAAE